MKAPCTETPWSYPYLENSLFSFPGVIKMGTPNIKLTRRENFLKQNGINGVHSNPDTFACHIISIKIFTNILGSGKVQ